MSHKVVMIARDNLGSRAKFKRFFWEIFPDMSVFGGPNGRPADLAIVFGDCESAWRGFPGTPYILIENDIRTMRTGEESAEERAMVEGAGLVIVPGDHFKDYLLSKYRCRRVEMVCLRPMLADLDFKPLPKLEGKHLVYAGGVEPADWRGRFCGYRALGGVFEKFIAAGWKVHIYTNFGPAHIGGYEEIGCRLHPAVPDGELYRELSQYTAGFQGYNRDGVAAQPFAYTQAARPNKTWMYLAAGIPTLGYDGGGAMEVYRGKWGFAIDSLDDLGWIDRRLEAYGPNLGLDIGYYRLLEVMDLDLLRIGEIARGIVARRLEEKSKEL